MEWLASTRQWLVDHKLNLLGFAVAAAYWPGLSSAAVIPRWGVIAVGVPLVSMMDPRGIPESLRWVFAFLLSAAVLATWGASPDPMAGYLELFYIVLLSLTFIAAASWNNLDGLMTGLGYGLALSTVLAMAQKLGYDLGLPQSSSPSGLFYNREILAEFSALVFVWAMLKPHHLIVAIASVPILLCDSRVAGITVVAGLAFAWWPQAWWKRIGLCAVIAALLTGWLFGLGFGKIGTADHRLILWTTTIASWTQFGHGLGWFLVAHPHEEFAHSDALQVIAELGLGGFVALAIPVIVFKQSKGHHAVERAIFVAILVQIAISFPLHFPASGFLAAAVAGFLAGHGMRLRLRQHLGRPEDAGDLRWQTTSGRRALGDERCGGRAVSIRSVYPRQGALHQAKDFANPATA